MLDESWESTEKSNDTHARRIKTLHTSIWELLLDPKNQTIEISDEPNRGNLQIYQQFHKYDQKF